MKFACFSSALLAVVIEQKQAWAVRLDDGLQDADGDSHWFNHGTSGNLFGQTETSASITNATIKPKDAKKTETSSESNEKPNKSQLSKKTSMKELFEVEMAKKS